MEKKNLRVTQKQNLSSDLLRNWVSVWHWNNFPTAATTKVFFFPFSNHIYQFPITKTFVYRGNFDYPCTGQVWRCLPCLFSKYFVSSDPFLGFLGRQHGKGWIYSKPHAARGREEKKPGAAPDACNPLAVPGPTAARSFLGRARCYAASPIDFVWFSSLLAASFLLSVLAGLEVSWRKLCLLKVDALRTSALCV